MNQLSGMKTSTAIMLNQSEISMLADAQEQGLIRGMVLLSKLTFNWKAIAKSGVVSGAKLARKGKKLAKGGDDESEAQSEIGGFMGRAWGEASEQLAGNSAIAQCARTLGVSVSEVINEAKDCVLSSELISELVPFWGSVKALIKGAKGIKDTRQKHNSFKALSEMAPVMASGFPTVAMDAFLKYARNETVLAAGKTAYTFAKGIGKLLVDIFAAPVASIIGFVSAVVEAVVSFAYKLIQGALFAKATEKARICVEEQKQMSIDDFRKIVSTSSFVGAVFFAAANYIGHFNLTALLSNTSNVISTNSLMDSVGKVSQVQRMACEYLEAAAFKVQFRKAQDSEEYGWLLKMMSGFADTMPKSEFLTEDATRWQRFKHKAKNMVNKGKRAKKKLPV